MINEKIILKFLNEEVDKISKRESYYIENIEIVKECKVAKYVYLHLIKKIDDGFFKGEFDV